VTSSAFSTTATLTAPSATGTYTYTITSVQDAIGCSNSTSASATVTVVAFPPPPTVTTPITYCQNATTVRLTATAAAGNILFWWGTNATGGTSTSQGPFPSTTTVGSTTYYVSQKRHPDVKGTRAPIVVNVTALPPPPTVVYTGCILSGMI
jgi:hypothetical protein